VDRDSSPDLLKAGCSRSVHRAGAEQVVKRFHSRAASPSGPFALLDRDRRRAAREYRVLQALAARGVAVPRPLELAPGAAGGWEVRMEHVPDRAPLIDVFLGIRPWPAPPARLAVELGRLFADLHAAGVRHADLHAGNVLVGSGRPVAIDFHKARVVERPGRGFPRAVARNLNQLAAGSREFVTPRFRARFFVAWYRALPEELRARLGDRGTLARRAEVDGRLLRRDVVRDRRLRWTREGTACRAVDGLHAFATHAVSDTLFASLRGLDAGLHAHPDDPARRVLVVAGDADAVRRGWYAAARLHEHGLPGGVPLAVELGERAWFALELPDATEPATLERARADGSLERLAGALRDRGVAPRGTGREHLFVAGGRALLAGVPGLTSRSDGVQRWLAALGASR